MPNKKTNLLSKQEVCSDNMIYSEMEMKNILMFAIVCLIFSCTKEDRTRYTATLKNNTTHKIIVLPYKSGVVFASDTIKLLPNAEFQIASGTQWGLSTVPGFSSKYAGGPDDSMIVVFDNLYKVSHYANTPANLSAKYLLFNSTRNILNPASYIFETIKVSRHLRSNSHRYEFVEQDYLYAQ